MDKGKFCGIIEECHWFLTVLNLPLTRQACWPNYHFSTTNLVILPHGSPSTLFKGRTVRSNVLCSQSAKVAFHCSGNDLRPLSSRIVKELGKQMHSILTQIIYPYITIMFTKYDSKNPVLNEPNTVSVKFKHPSVCSKNRRQTIRIRASIWHVSGVVTAIKLIYDHCKCILYFPLTLNSKFWLNFKHNSCSDNVPYVFEIPLVDSSLFTENSVVRH